MNKKVTKKIIITVLTPIVLFCAYYITIITMPTTYDIDAIAEDELFNNPFLSGLGPVYYEQVIVEDDIELNLENLNEEDDLNTRVDVVILEPEPEPFIVTHIKTPPIVKGVYMTSWVGGVIDWRTRIMQMIEDTELNAIVIDIKDDTGRISFEVLDPYLIEVGSQEKRIPDIKEFIAELHKRDIYVIGRISVFQDSFFVKHRPDLAVRRASNGEVWLDRKGIAWLDAGSQDVWDYIVAIGKDSYAVGFDELNFDYIRFPSDGNIADIAYPFSEGKVKSEVLAGFYQYLEEKLRPTGATLSADLFGMTTSQNDDLNIGQILEDAAAHFDYIAPMVYPSHYPPNFIGIADPNTDPYSIVKYAMDMGVKKLKAASTTPHALHGTIVPHQLRPWLQDFDYGGIYGEAEIRAQKKAVYDAGLTSWLMWDPRVVYTREAFNDAF